MEEYTDAMEENFTEFTDLEAAEYPDLGDGHNKLTRDTLILKYYNGLSQQIQSRLKVRELNTLQQGIFDALAEERYFKGINKRSELNQVLQKLDKLSTHETINTYEKNIAIIAKLTIMIRITVKEIRITHTKKKTYCLICKCLFKYFLRRVLPNMKKWTC